MKVCSVCNQELPITEFDIQSTGKLGRRADCKQCRKRFTRAERGLVKSMISTQRAKSKKRNHPAPNYTEQELFVWVTSQSNFRELFQTWVDTGYPTKNKPSVDRINDYLPYTLDNIQLVTHAQNINRFYSDMLNGINTKRCQRVNQYDLNGNFIRQFHSFREAGRAVNTSPANIRNVAKQVVITVKNSDGSIRQYVPQKAAGFHWKLA